MYTVGLTGGIGSGKSLVSSLFAAHGICIVDTDIIARDLVGQNTPHLAQIISHFGQDFLLEDGRLDRRLLRQRMLESPEDKRWLESLLHPAIRAEAKHAVSLCTTPYCVIVIPLLVEAGRQHYDFIDRVAVVDCPENLQLSRTMARDGITESQALAMLNAQATRTSRNAFADDVIDNTGDNTYLKLQVDELHRKYLELSQNS